MRLVYQRNYTGVTSQNILSSKLYLIVHKKMHKMKLYRSFRLFGPVFDTV
jgi:hypothetical protein